MNDEILNALLYGRIPSIPWTLDGEQEAVGFALGIAEAFEDAAPRPIKERERAAKRTLKARPNDADALQMLVKIDLERSAALYEMSEGSAGSLLRVPVSPSKRRQRKSKKSEQLLVTLLALIWEWREGIQPTRTVNPYNGQPTGEFYEWAAGIAGKNPLWVLKRFKT